MDKILIMGIGNEIKRDDAVGLRILEKVKERINGDQVDFRKSSSGRILLFDEIRGYDKVFLIDSIKTEDGEPGNWYDVDLESFESESSIFSSHNVSIDTIRNMGETMGEDVPEIKILAVEVEDPFEFGEGLTDRLAGKFPKLVSELTEFIRSELS